MAQMEGLKAILRRNTRAANDAVSERLPLDNHADFDAARRGWIAGLPDGKVPAPGGRIAWNIHDYDFLNAPCPETINPSLQRMGQLNNISGLFEVTEGVWQARACDYANMTVIRGETGWILIDPLMTRQTSKAALDLVNDTLGTREISAIIVTHTHPDHFGGLKGVTGEDPAKFPPIYAPEEFMTYAASEGILGGNQMMRRATYQFGLTLPVGPEGTVDGGIGKSPAKGQRTFVPPTEFIGMTGEERVIDGVRFIFQMASGTEAPAEFTFMLPDHRVLCMAEVCTQTMHNALPPRGSQARDVLLWARTIDEAITLFADQTDILINCHNWPVWGAENVLGFLQEQRDIYKYTHDQTLRLANLGHTPNEIAARIAEPDWLSETFHARGYYGTLKFNARAVYQLYYGFYDGNPVNIDPMAPEELGRKMLAAFGGMEPALALAADAIERDELQWAATVLNHAVFGSEDNLPARAMLSEVYRHLGYREESGIMRNVYLSGAKELAEGITPLPMVGGRNEDLAKSLGLQDWFDAYALRLNPERARGVSLVLNFDVGGEQVCVGVARQTEFARIGHAAADADVSVAITKPQLEAMASGEIQDVDVTGNKAAFEAWVDLHDSFDLWFNIVTP